MTSIASPYSIGVLPRQARYYKKAFRSGTRGSSRGSRLINRIAFYVSETLRNKPCYGRFDYVHGDDVRSIRFDARNRQYSALYFDAFLPIYEPDVTAAVLAFAPPNGVFFDIGSNWGYFSLFLAARPGFSGRIHAFEPWPATYTDLTSMVSQAGLQRVITCHQLALGEQSGAVAMACGRHSGLARIVADAPDRQSARVEQARLDDLDIPLPDFMKLDVEGAEAAILRGARRVIHAGKPIIIFEHTPDPGEANGAAVRQLLAEENYDLYQPLPTLGPEAPGLLTLRPLSDNDVDRFDQRCNLLAVPRDRQDSVGPYLTGG